MTAWPDVLLALLKPPEGYPDVTKPTHPRDKLPNHLNVRWDALVSVSWSRADRRTAVPDLIPSTAAPYTERTATGERLPFCRRSTTLFSMVCPNGHTSARWVPCGQLDCLTCRDGASFRPGEKRRKVGVVGRRRGETLYKRFGAPALGMWVFTWPQARSLTCRQVSTMRRRVHDAVAAYYWHHFGVEVGVYSFIHPCGDKTQGGRPHCHVQVPLLGLRNGELVKIHHWVTDEQQDSMTDLAMQVQCGIVEGRANAHYRYRAIPEKKLHGLSYDGRAFPAWAAGDMPIALLKGRGSGLLAPRCGSLGIDEWRDAVSQDGLEEDDAIPMEEGVVEEKPPPTDIDIRAGLACYCCGLMPVVVDTVRADSWRVSTMGPVVDAWGHPERSVEARSVEDDFGEAVPNPPPGWRPVPIHDADIPF